MIAVLAVVALAALVEYGWYRHARNKRDAEMDARYNVELTPAEVAALDAFLREQAKQEQE